MKVYLVTETNVQAINKFRIIKIFDNPEAATECYDDYNSYMVKDGVYRIDIVEWTVDSDY